MKNYEQYILIVNILIFIAYFVTMLLMWRQVRIANKEFKLRNRPVVGISNIEGKYSIKDESKLGKNIFWNTKENKFYCEDNPIDIENYRIFLEIKNYGSEIAVDLVTDNEIFVGNTSIKIVGEKQSKMSILPKQTVKRILEISREIITGAFRQAHNITINIFIYYSDFERKPNQFKYEAKILFLENRQISLSILGCNITENY